ncbi:MULTISPECIES: hypothetical protein [unclassified Streptomyces]|uniref:hypothetical protein n=1 Tax=unclassified Streptomyces TaxID=2593676 RepID=UPI00081E711E|nr:MULTISPECIES: hypothetical protein [unclassified Streptomyces]MYZ39767.1 hypothetical protein [Streptomyces sp. SID4917]SCG05168.1 hypothetical protein GA0115259_109351 [Streptomyces sp. MnatMP-M17]
MRPSHRRTATALTTALLIATGFAVSSALRDIPVPVADLSVPASGGGMEPARPDRFGATCRTKIEGSRATASCHNPYPETDRLRLHVECERWWDIDADSEAVEIAAARYAELAERCWMEIRQVWITHERVAS